jgi:cold shock protein
MPLSETAVEKGAVKFYNATRGFGFISPDNASTPDIFFHCSSVEVPEYSRDDLLQPGARVEYQCAKGPDGRERAVNVVVL